MAKSAIILRILNHFPTASESLLNSINSYCIQVSFNEIDVLWLHLNQKLTTDLHISHIIGVLQEFEVENT